MTEHKKPEAGAHGGHKRKEHKAHAAEAGHHAAGHAEKGSFAKNVVQTVLSAPGKIIKGIRVRLRESLYGVAHMTGLNKLRGKKGVFHIGRQGKRKVMRVIDKTTDIPLDIGHRVEQGGKQIFWGAITGRRLKGLNGKAANDDREETDEARAA